MAKRPFERMMHGTDLVETMERLFLKDVLTKRERVERTLNFQPVDRAALHEQLSYNPGVIAHYTRRRIAETWRRHGLKVLFHSDGNWKSLIPDLVQCGVDGFYCLEPSLGMDIVALRKAWPNHVWAGGIDGVDLMERGTPEQVRREVRRIIEETGLLQCGGVLIDTSSEINPPIRPENFQAMVETVGEILNTQFL